MRWGCCGSIDQANTIRDAGFDFLEVNVQAVLRGDESDAEWTKAAPKVSALPLPIEAANSLVPATRPIIGPGRDVKGLTDYLGRVTRRAKQLGITRLVFGSGAARKRPNEVDEITAMTHLREFTRIAGDACAANDIILVIEHLHRGETNTLNSLASCLQLQNDVDHPAVMMLVDSFHYGLEREDDQALLDLDGTLKHVHVAEPVGRGQPGAVAVGDEPFDFDLFFSLLCKIGYNDRVSIEAVWTEPIAQAGPVALELLKAACERASNCEC